MPSGVSSFSGVAFEAIFGTGSRSSSARRARCSARERRTFSGMPRATIRRHTRGRARVTQNGRDYAGGSPSPVRKSLYATTAPWPPTMKLGLRPLAAIVFSSNAAPGPNGPPGVYVSPLTNSTPAFGM
jgi:hypothetical protein